MRQRGSESQAPCGRFNLDDQWLGYIAQCAKRSADSYDEREDLVSDTVKALLEYDKQIEHPRSFIRTTVRRLATNRACVGAGARELNNSELGVEMESVVAETELSVSVIIRDTLQRLLQSLTPAEARCYELLKAGYEQRDLPRLLGISRQAVSKLLAGIRWKYEVLELEDAD